MSSTPLATADDDPVCDHTTVHPSPATFPSAASRTHTAPPEPPTSTAAIPRRFGSTADPDSDGDVDMDVDVFMDGEEDGQIYETRSEGAHTPGTANGLDARISPSTPDWLDASRTFLEPSTPAPNAKQEAASTPSPSLGLISPPLINVSQAYPATPAQPKRRSAQILFDGDDSDCEGFPVEQLQTRFSHSTFIPPSRGRPSLPRRGASVQLNRRTVRSSPTSKDARTKEVDSRSGVDSRLVTPEAAPSSAATSSSSSASPSTPSASSSSSSPPNPSTPTNTPSFSNPKKKPTKADWPVRSYRPSPADRTPRLALQNSPNPLPSPMRGPDLHPNIFHTRNQRGVQVRDYSAVRQGEVLVRENPPCAVLHDQLLETHCSGCLRGPHHFAEDLGVDEEDAAKRFLHCSGCEKVVYCSTRCYAMSAETHFSECRAFRRVGVPSPEVRLVARVCWARRRGPEVELAAFPLHSAPPPINFGELIKQIKVFLSRVEEKAGLPRVAWEKYGLRDEAELQVLVRAIISNIFPVSDRMCSPVGLCVSPVVAHIEHSCKPNAVLVFPFGTQIDQPLRVVALKDMAANEKVTISYIDTGIPRKRRAAVLTMYGMQHACEGCTPGLAVDPRWAGIHGCDYGGLVPILDRASCGMCGEEGWVELSETPYADIFARLEASIDACAHGQRKLSSKTLKELEDEGVHENDGPQALAQEAALLTVELRNMHDLFSEALYPLGHLHARLGRLLMNIETTTPGRIVSNCDAAIEALSTARTIYREWSEGEPHPLHLALSLDKIECHLRAVQAVIRSLVHAGYGTSTRRRSGSGTLKATQRLTQTIERDLSKVRADKVVLADARLRASHLSLALFEAQKDGVMLGEGWMRTRLERYQRRIDGTLFDWLTHADDDIRREERRLKGEKLMRGAVASRVRPSVLGTKSHELAAGVLGDKGHKKRRMSMSEPGDGGDLSNNLRLGPKPTLKSAPTPKLAEALEVRVRETPTPRVAAGTVFRDLVGERVDEKKAWRGQAMTGGDAAEVERAVGNEMGQAGDAEVTKTINEALWAWEERERGRAAMDKDRGQANDCDL